jgi:hypothetical protein
MLIMINWNLSVAQEVGTSATNRSHSLFDGSRALQFRITNDFVLYDFQGAALSAKKHFSGNSAIRLGADLFFDFSTEDVDSRIFSSDTINYTSDAEIRVQRVMLELQYIHYVSAERKMKFFWGTGPTMLFNREITDTDYYDSRFDISHELKNEDKSWGLGGSGILGVEWFATSYISFHTEYMLTVLYEWRKIRDDDVAGPDFTQISTETSGFQAYASNIRFGLSLYF